MTNTNWSDLFKEASESAVKSMVPNFLRLPLMRSPMLPIDRQLLVPRLWPFFFLGFLGMYLETHLSPLTSWHLQSHDARWVIGHLPSIAALRPSMMYLLPGLKGSFEQKRHNFAFCLNVTPFGMPIGTVYTTQSNTVGTHKQMTSLMQFTWHTSKGILKSKAESCLLPGCQSLWHSLHHS